MGETALTTPDRIHKNLRMLVRAQRRLAIMLEKMVLTVQGLTCCDTKDRMEELENMSDQKKAFRKFT